MAERHREACACADAEAFYEKYYVPANITIAIVGDVNPAEAQAHGGEDTSGRIPARPMPPPVHTEEPEQAGPKRAMRSRASAAVA